jgi:hypothetical protein
VAEGKNETIRRISGIFNLPQLNGSLTSAQSCAVWTHLSPTVSCHGQQAIGRLEGCHAAIFMDK